MRAQRFTERFNFSSEFDKLVSKAPSTKYEIFVGEP